MKRLLWLVILFVQVIAFGWHEARAGGFGQGGGAVSYFGNWFMDSLSHNGPVLMIALGFFISAQGRGVDFSLAAMAALIACVMSRFKADLLWTAAVPAGVSLALLLGGIHGVVTARLRLLVPLITLAFMSLYRGIAFGSGVSPATGFLDGGVYEWLGGFFGVLTTVMTCHVLTILGRWLIRPRTDAAAAPKAPSNISINALLYAVAAGTAALAAILVTAQSGKAQIDMLAGAEIPALVIVLLAGTHPLRGGGSAITLLLAGLNMAVFLQGIGLNSVTLGSGVTEADLLRYAAVAVIGIAAFMVYGVRKRLAKQAAPQPNLAGKS